MVLADACTALLHGEAVLEGVKATAASVFAAGGGGGGDDGDLPRLAVAAGELEGAGKPVVDLLVGLGMAKSKSEARRLIAGGGARVDGEKVEGEAAALTAAALGGRAEVRVSAGKKRHGVVVVT